MGKESDMNSTRGQRTSAGDLPIATGDRVLCILDGEPRELAALETYVVSERVHLDGYGPLSVDHCALLPPDADGDLVAIANVLQGALVTALRRRTGIQYAAHGPVFLTRGNDNETGHPGFLAACALARCACYGETSREALRWLASELWHQLDALKSGPEFPLMLWADAAMTAAGTPVLAADRFSGGCDAGADMRGAWLDDVNSATAAATGFCY